MKPPKRFLLTAQPGLVQHYENRKSGKRQHKFIFQLSIRRLFLSQPSEHLQPEKDLDSWGHDLIEYITDANGFAGIPDRTLRVERVGQI